VIVDGEIVVRAGRPVRVDADVIAAASRAAATGLWRRLETIDVHPFEPGRAP
jgi:hypothetical protein